MILQRQQNKRQKGKNGKPTSKRRKWTNSSVRRGLYFNASKALLAFHQFLKASKFSEIEHKNPQKELCVKVKGLVLSLSTMVSSSATISASFVSKRSRSPEPPAHTKLTLKVKNQQGAEDIYKIGGNAHLKKLMTAYCIKRNLEYSTVRFLYNGKRIKPRETPAQLRMEEEDEIVSVMELGGGGPYAP